MPGAAVHGPLILAATAVGFFLCWPHPMLRPLLVIWMLTGLYLGRDIAILCHYTPLLTLVTWAASALVLLRPGPIANFGRSHAVVAAVLSAAVGLVLLLVAWAATRESDSAA
jgi:hypothetical protein